MYQPINVYQFQTKMRNELRSNNDGVLIVANSQAQKYKNQGFNTVPQVWALLIANNYIFAGTTAQSVWRRLDSEITGIQNTGMEIPSNYSLSQNYPNPFNPATTISFSLPSQSVVSLKVFDALGREVSILISEELPAGTYAQQWNAEGLASGVYFYRLSVGSLAGQAGVFSETKKFILLR
jgi:hypothetical protein